MAAERVKGGRGDREPYRGQRAVVKKQRAIERIEGRQGNRRPKREQRAKEGTENFRMGQMAAEETEGHRVAGRL